MPTPCQPHANPMPAPCGPMLTQCQPHAIPMPTPCQPHANPMMIAPCQPHANPMPTPCHLVHAIPMPTPCQPHANPMMLAPCQPHANPMPTPCDTIRRGFPPGPQAPLGSPGSLRSEVYGLWSIPYPTLSPPPSPSSASPCAPLPATRFLVPKWRSGSLSRLCRALFGADLWIWTGL
jgi:hypothetical protein